MRALESLGILDEVLKKLPPFGRTVKGFLFYSGLGDHELLYDVRTTIMLALRHGD